MAPVQLLLASLVALFAVLLAGVPVSADWLGLLKDGADPPEAASTWEIPSRVGKPLRGFFLPDAAADTAHGPGISHLEPDRELRPHAAVPLLSHPARRQQGLQTQAGPRSWGLDRVDGNEDGQFRYIASGGSGITVYVLDSGIASELDEFEGRATKGPNFSNDTSTTDNEGHGTFTAAIIGGKEYGVAKKVKIVGVKVTASEGIGRVSDFVRGLLWVLDETKNGTGDPSIISLSIGTEQSMLLDQAMNYIVDLGIPVVASAGNQGEDACNWSPGSALAVLTVGATNRTNEVATYSNFGPCVKIWAPGSDIVSIFPNGTESVRTGTSFSSPHVAGVGSRAGDGLRAAS
ncbi:peptidase S8/S53 domain-containing protein [Hyaloraphidium curvatum]|nr:peptidase S8/S53 domain-containing protein [Hyaloraphidium curvatum]